MLILTEQYIKNTLPISESTDFKLLKIHCEEAQFKFGPELFGDTLYEDLIGKFIGQGLNDIEAKLMNYFKKYIAYRAYARFIVVINAQVANNGVTIRTGENFNAQNSDKIITRLQNEYLNEAEYWRNYIVKFLCKYSADFPLFESATDNIIEPKNKQRQSSGIIFY